MTINPDDFLETPEGRIWTPERNEEAWRLSYAALERALERAPASKRVVVVCGIQGAGKSTWIASQPASPGTIYFDAALPGVRHRAKVIGIAKQLGSAVEAVWIDTPLDAAIERNAARTPDKMVPMRAIVAVAKQFVEPTAAEGFDHVAVHHGGPSNGRAPGCRLAKLRGLTGAGNSSTMSGAHGRLWAAY